ncbi:hypothetical protein FOZ60_002518 [Perkinsus olseni]|uniref:AAA+ ATPase domain-containing protein n=3 Tax=Perkinsus olseni TaxID=32597 RepID=A0A7J6NXM9_PEROL|nr:hypothetical protein FOZ60_002518 [Perkinsus olseni]
MSNKSWQHRWAGCMTELLEQIHVEHLPANTRENGQALDIGFQPFALVYIKYLHICTNLEEIYDQMIHPQKRKFIRRVMESIILRVLELKEQLIFFNPRHKNRFIALDEILADLKLSPAVLDWRFPRCFTADTHLADWLEIRNKRIQHWQKTFNLSRTLDDLDDHTDPFHIPFTLDQAIRLIQRNERGRAGIQKAMMIANWRREAERREKRLAEGVDFADLEDDSEELLAAQRAAVSKIAASWKRKSAIRCVQRMKQEEYIFLGMLPPVEKPPVDQIALAEEIRVQRRQSQIEASSDYDKALDDELALSRKIKGPDLHKEMLDERREWILEVRKQTGAFPADLEAFYTRFDQPEETVEGEGDGGKQSKDGKKASDKKGGDKKASKTVAETEPENTHDVGTSAVVQSLVEQLKEYAATWETRDESQNVDQLHDVQLVRDKVFPVVEREMQNSVDELMREELANLKNMYEKAKKKKEKKGKKGKGKKEKKGKVKKWCAAVGMVPHREDCLPELVQDGLVKCIAPARLKDYIGEFGYLGAARRVCLPACPPPSAQMVKSLIVEHVALPLASTTIRQQCNLAARSILLYGPKGCGKSLLARIIATEAGATFIDISPKKIEGKYTQPKVGPALLIYKAFLVAQDNAPAVIYCDEIDQVFQAVKKGKKKGKAAASTAEGADEASQNEPPSRIKKDFIAAIKQIKTGPDSTDQDRIVFIGCTSNPFGESVDTKELLAAFDEKVWISTPDFGTRIILWRSFMEEKGVPSQVTTSGSLNLTSLAHLSEGYTTRSIKQAVDRVLSNRRLSRLKQRPLTLHEFLEPLSRCHYSWKEEYKKFQEFDYEASGDKARNLQMQEETKKLEASAEAEKGDKKKK